MSVVGHWLELAACSCICQLQRLIHVAEPHLLTCNHKIDKLNGTQRFAQSGRAHRPNTCQVPLLDQGLRLSHCRWHGTSPRLPGYETDGHTQTSGFNRKADRGAHLASLSVYAQLQTSLRTGRKPIHWIMACQNLHNEICFWIYRLLPEQTIPLELTMQQLPQQPVPARLRLPVTVPSKG